MTGSGSPSPQGHLASRRRGAVRYGGQTHAPGRLRAERDRTVLPLRRRRRHALRSPRQSRRGKTCPKALRALHRLSVASVIDREGRGGNAACRERYSDTFYFFTVKLSAAVGHLDPRHRRRALIQGGVLSSQSRPPPCHNGRSARVTKERAGGGRSRPSPAGCRARKGTPDTKAPMMRRHLRSFTRRRRHRRCP
jgi:hypothetical protein